MNRLRARLFLLFGCFLAFATAESSRAEAGLAVAAGEGGRLHVVDGEKVVCTFTPMAANASWAFTQGMRKGDPAGGKAPFSLTINQTKLQGLLWTVPGKAGANAGFDFTAKEPVAFQTLGVATDFAIAELAGTSWQADGRTGVFPAQLDRPHLFGGEVQRLVIRPKNKPELAFSFPVPTRILLQDNRQWGNADFSLRIGRGEGKLAAGEIAKIFLRVEGAAFRDEVPLALRPVVMEAGEEWIPLREELEIVPGSALDLSTQGFIDGPCGEDGRIIATPDGHFAFADEPEKPRRFYGVNFCFSAQFLPKEKVDRLLDRLVRLGYNTVRIHHYEGELTKPSWRPGFDWNAEKVDQLDYLLAGCAKRGLWVTTDLYVSRPVSGKQIGRAEKEIEMDRFKILVPVSEAAFQDWAAFARKFLDRVNPYTGLRLAEDPAIAWLSLINEGPISNQWNVLRQMPEWQAAWNRWLQKRFPSPEAQAAALGDSAADSGKMPDGLSDDTPRSRLAQAFVAETELATFERMKKFLREELRCDALLTNMNNAGPSLVPLQLARDRFDYVDEHFYVDHPQFLEEPWRLPSSSPNSNPISSGAQGGTGPASVRLFDKPFTITEYNYSGPGRFRGVGGILTGALAALQDWDGLWRFAYSHTAATLFEPGPIAYFDLVSDPLNQAADRLSLFLYLRGDLAVAPSRLAVELPEDSLGNPPPGLNLSNLRAAAWRTRIGSRVLHPGESMPSGFVSVPAVSDRAAISAALEEIPPPSEPGVIRSETGQISLSPGDAVLVIDTPKSAGGYADPGKVIAAAGVRVENITTGATVFVNSLDKAPIPASKRLLVTHLTDLQNTGGRYGEAARQTLLEWGTLPHLVREGSARVSIPFEEPEVLEVWTLSPGGRRVEKLASKVENGRLIFTVGVKGSEGARMLYEIAEKGAD
jgi:hypothetical protein